MADVEETLTIAAGETETSSLADCQGDSQVSIQINGDAEAGDVNIIPVVKAESGDPIGPMVAPRLAPNDNPQVELTNVDVTDLVYLNQALLEVFVRVGVRLINNGGTETSIDVEINTGAC